MSQPFSRIVSYIILATTIALVVFTLALFVPNLALLSFGLQIDGVTLWDKLIFMGSFYLSLLTNFTFVSAFLTVLISVMFGINISLLMYYVRSQQKNGGGIRVSGAASVGGLISGFFGIGCAACGSVILTSLLSLFGASGLLTLLPLGGEEFAFLAVAILGYSMFTLRQRIKAGNVCLIK